MKKLLLLAAALCVGLGSQAQTAPKRELRAVWLTTHLSLDWPNRTQTPAQQRTALLGLLDHNKATGLNSVFLQVRSQADAIYPSSIEPWSYYMTGTQGVAPNPAWDPLQFAIDESRKRGLEIHAWINPYRAVSDATAAADPLKYAANHISKTRPEWLLALGNVRILNPGLPEVRDYIRQVTMDIVQRYDVDGLHFDDYFYQTGSIADDAAYAADPRGFPATAAGRADWRRDNVNLLISEVGAAIRAAKPWVKFGVSPSGIYRSNPGYPNGVQDPALGSWTTPGAFQHYNNSYADTLKWLQSGWVDYLAPQLYWFIGQTGSDYQLLLPWWSLYTYNRHIYIGLADYKMNMTGWTAPSPNNQIAQQIAMNRATAGISGQAHFRQAFLVANPLGYRSELMATQYKRAALLPGMAWKGSGAPTSPSGLSAINSGAVVNLAWSPSAASSDEFRKLRRYAVYRAEQPWVNVEDPAQLVGLTNAGETSFADTTAEPGKFYFYAVTGLNRLHAESAPSTATSNDRTPPTVLTQNLSRSLAAGTASVSAWELDGGSTDNWGIASLSLSKSSFSCADLGANSVNLTATDKAGNSAAAPATVSITGARPSTAIAITNSSTVVTGFPANTVTLGVGAQTLLLTAKDGTPGAVSSYAWTPAPGLSALNGANATFAPTAAGSYSFTVRTQNQFGCVTDTRITLVAVDKRRGR